MQRGDKLIIVREIDADPASSEKTDLIAA